MPESEIKHAMQHPNKLGAGAEKRKTLDPADKREVVMREFGRGTLHSGSGEIVTDPKQAAAIAYSEAEKRARHRAPRVPWGKK